VLDTISQIFAAALAVESVAWSRRSLLIALALMILAATLCVIVVVSLARSRRRAGRPQPEEADSGENVLAVLLERTRARAEREEEPRETFEAPEERLELCEIGWSPGRLRSQFSARALAPDGRACVVGVSPRLWLRRSPPRARKRTLKAYGLLVRQLGDAGWRAAGATELWFRWQPLGRRSLWYEERFRRPALSWAGLGRGDAGGVRNSPRTQDR
jgi:hypothetical protein